MVGCPYRHRRRLSISASPTALHIGIADGFPYRHRRRLSISASPMACILHRYGRPALTRGFATVRNTCPTLHTCLYTCLCACLRTCLYTCLCACLHTCAVTADACCAGDEVDGAIGDKQCPVCGRHSTEVGPCPSLHHLVPTPPLVTSCRAAPCWAVTRRGWPI